MRFKLPARNRALQFWFPVTLVLSISACSSIPGMGKEDPRDARRYASLPNLDVPPAFTAPDPSRVTSVPRAASALGEAAKGERSSSSSGVLPKSATVSVEGPPDARWLNVQAAPDVVWTRLIGFMQLEGYPVDRQDPNIGLLESDWVGKGDSAPTQAGWQTLLKGITEFFFKPSYMDRLRLRIERGEGDAQTRVFLTSQRMDLTDDKPYVRGDVSEGFEWKAAPGNREFDAEMLERLMAYLSGNDEQARAQIAASLQPRVTFVNEENKQFLELDQSLPVAFNRTRAAAERLGFDIVKADVANESLQLRHINPRSLYEGVVLRGAELKPDMGKAPLTLTLQLRAMSASKTQINMTDFQGGKDLPQLTTVLGGQLARQLR
jgi:outer membrane protein assembly factor BamC